MLAFKHARFVSELICHGLEFSLFSMQKSDLALFLSPCWRQVQLLQQQHAVVFQTEMPLVTARELSNHKCECKSPDSAGNYSLIVLVTKISCNVWRWPVSHYQNAVILTVIRQQRPRCQICDTLKLFLETDYISGYFRFRYVCLFLGEYCNFTCILNVLEHFCFVC